MHFAIFVSFPSLDLEFDCLKCSNGKKWKSHRQNEPIAAWRCCKKRFVCEKKGEVEKDKYWHVCKNYKYLDYTHNKNIRKLYTWLKFNSTYSIFYGYITDSYLSMSIVESLFFF